MTLGKYQNHIQFVFYEVIVLLAIPSFISIPVRTAFVLYATFLYWIITNTNLPTFTLPPSEQSLTRFWRILLVSSIVFFIASRLYPFLRYGEAPLGYDTGFYIQYYRIIDALQSISPLSISTSHFTYAWWLPFIAFKIPALWTINILHITHQILTLGAVYFLTNSIPEFSKKPIPTFSIILFSLSTTQYMAFWWMFYKQSMAIPFFLFGIGLMLRRHWLAFYFIGIGAAIHFQTVIPLAAALIAHVFLQCIFRWRKREKIFKFTARSLGAGLLILVIILILKGPHELLYYWEYIQRLQGLATNAPELEVLQAKGLFIPPTTYSLNSMYYLPFGILGFLHCLQWFRNKRDEKVFPLVLLIVLTILSVFPFIYQNRSLIFLDVLLIVFASPVLFIFIQRFLGMHRHAAPMLIVFLLSAFMFSGRIIVNHPPQVPPEELSALKQLPALMKPSSYVMTTSSTYAPWVWAFTDRETIAPGLLNWDRWNYTDWKQFWFSQDDKKRIVLLNMYNAPIYIFIGKNQPFPDPLKAFLVKETQPLTQYVWKYEPH